MLLLARGLVASLVMAAALVWSAPADAATCDEVKLCYKDSRGDGTGVPIRWLTQPVKYVVNASLLDTQKQTKAIDAVKAAFELFNKITCSYLRFTYDGTTTSFSEVKGKINVFFGNRVTDPSSWIHGTDAYYRILNFTSYKTGEISDAYAGLNAYDYGWTKGAEVIAPPPAQHPTYKIDIQTTVMWMIPDLVGFTVSKDYTKTDLPIAYNTVQSSLCPKHIDGSRYIYFKSDTGCTKPTKPAVCPGGPVPPDGLFTEPGIGLEPYQPLDMGPPEGGTDGHGGDTEDDGCCRVSHARGASASSSGWALLGLALLLLLGRRRRR